MPALLSQASPPGILPYRYRARKMGFRPFRPFRPALAPVAVSGGRAMAGVSAVSASVMPISRPSAGRPLPGSRNSRNFRKRYANGRWLGVAGVGRRIARARIVATGNSFAPHGGPEIDVRRGRGQCHRAMALREIIEASEHDADPVQVGLGRHTPHHCSVLSTTIGRDPARPLHGTSSGAW